MNREEIIKSIQEDMRSLRCGSLEDVTTSLGATSYDARRTDRMGKNMGNDFTTSLGATDYAEDSDQDSALSQAMRSDGSTAKYYELPIGAIELQDLISYRNMNAQIGEVFRAAYRYGQASHSDKLRDAKKIRFYAEAEIERLERYGNDR